MKKMVNFTLIAAIALCTVLVTSCGKVTEVSGNKHKSQRKTIGISFATLNNPFDKAEKESLLASAKENHYDVIVTDAKGRPNKQHDNIMHLVSKKIDYLVLVPTKQISMGPVLTMAMSAKIPVIVINRKVDGTPGVEYTTMITGNAKWEGAAAAKWILANTTGVVHVVRLVGSPGASVTIERTEGFNSVGPKDRIKTVTSLVCDFSKDEAYKLFKDYLKEHIKSDDKINAIFAQNDAMALGAIKAIEEINENNIGVNLKPGKDILIIGVDGEEAAKKAIEAGTMNATVSSSPKFGPIVFSNINKLNHGVKIKPIQTIKGKVYDKTNIENLDAF